MLFSMFFKEVKCFYPDVFGFQLQLSRQFHDLAVQIISNSYWYQHTITPQPGPCKKAQRLRDEVGAIALFSHWYPM